MGVCRPGAFQNKTPEPERRRQNRREGYGSKVNRVQITSFMCAASARRMARRPHRERGNWHSEVETEAAQMERLSALHYRLDECGCEGNKHLKENA